MDALNDTYRNARLTDQALEQAEKHATAGREIADRTAPRFEDENRVTKEDMDASHYHAAIVHYETEAATLHANTATIHAAQVKENRQKEAMAEARRARSKAAKERNELRRQAKDNRDRIEKNARLEKNYL